MPDVACIQVFVDLDAIRDAVGAAPGAAGMMPVAVDMLRRLVKPSFPAFVVPDPPHCLRSDDDTCQSTRHRGAHFASAASRWCAAALAAGASEEDYLIR